MARLSARQDAAIRDSLHHMLAETFRDLDRQFGDSDGEISLSEMRRYPGVGRDEAD